MQPGIPDDALRLAELQDDRLLGLADNEQGARGQYACDDDDDAKYG